MSTRSSSNSVEGEPPLKKARTVVAGSEAAETASPTSSTTIAHYYGVRKGKGGIRNCIFLSWHDAKHCLEDPENEQAVEYERFDKMEDALGYIHHTKTDAPLTAAAAVSPEEPVQQMVKNYGTQAVANALVQAAGMKETVGALVDVSGLETVEQGIRTVKKHQTEERLLLNKSEIWLNCIFPFVGLGSYAFVALISPRHRELYREYCTANLAKDPPKVGTGEYRHGNARAARATDTFYSAVFFSVACAKYWDKDTEGNRYPRRMGDTTIWRQAIKAGNLEVVKWVHRRGFDRGDFFNACQWAACCGHLEILKYLQEIGCPLHPWLCGKAAAAKGHFSVLKYLHYQKGATLDAWTCSGAAAGGHLDILKWARKKGAGWDGDTCTSAAGNGHLDVLMYAHGQGCPWGKYTSNRAAAGGHLKVLRWAHHRGCPWDAETCVQAAANKHLDILKYLHENECPWDKRTCEEAAEKGRLDILKYAHEKGCPWDKNTCKAAAFHGHLDILKYAHEKGCPWDEETCSSAAVWGDWKVLRYAREKGCPWDANTISEANRNGHDRIAAWARKNGCPSPEDD